MKSPELINKLAQELRESYIKDKDIDIIETPELNPLFDKKGYSIWLEERAIDQLIQNEKDIKINKP